MTPPTTPDDGDATGSADSTPTHRPSPAATAASRARRIGGRTGSVAASRPDAGTDAGADEPIAKPGPTPEADAGAPISVTKASKTSKTKAKAEASPFPAALSDPPRPGTAASVPAWLRWAPATLLTCAALAMVVVLVVTSHGVWWGKPSSTAVRNQVLAAAKTCVAKTNTYTYTDLNTYEREGLTCATGAYTSQFRQAVEKIIKKNAPTLKAVQSTQINTAAIEDVTKSGRWSVLMFGQIKVTNASYPDGRTDPFGAVVQMQKVHGKWLISDLKTVSSPVPNGG